MNHGNHGGGGGGGGGIDGGDGGDGGDGLWAWTGLLGPRSRRPAGMGGDGPPTASLSLSGGGGGGVGGTLRLGDTMPVGHMLEWTVISTLKSRNRFILECSKVS